MRVKAFIFLLISWMFSAPAFADTTVYTDSSNFGAWPNAVNSGNSVGAADGNSATIPNGGWIAYQVTTSFTSVDFYLKLTSSAGSGTALFYVGRTNGAGWFSALNNRTIALTSGANVLSTNTTQTNFCVSLGGCDVFVVQAWAGTTLGLDSAVAANPEPSAWALMILGFGGLAWRMKALRRAGATAFTAQAA